MSIYDLSARCLTRLERYSIDAQNLESKSLLPHFLRNIKIFAERLGMVQPYFPSLYRLGR